MKGSVECEFFCFGNCEVFQNVIADIHVTRITIDFLHLHNILPAIQKRIRRIGKTAARKAAIKFGALLLVAGNKAKTVALTFFRIGN